MLGAQHTHTKTLRMLKRPREVRTDVDAERRDQRDEVLLHQLRLQLSETGGVGGLVGDVGHH